MRKIVAAAALIVTAMFFAHQPLFSQKPATPTASTQDLQLLRKDLQSQKKQMVAANMTLTDAEALKFWPIYDQYSAELAKINDTRLSLVKEYAANYASLTDAQAQSVVERWTAADDAVIQLRAKYIPIFHNALPGKKTALFFQVDRRIGMLMDLQVASEIPLVEP
jgi:Spy/CpxP family protein refolding chaperone